MLALDISNYNAFTPAYAQQVKAQGIGHIIVRGGLSGEHPGLIDLAQRQLQIAKDAGLQVSVYIWAYFNSADPAATAQEALDLYDSYEPAIYWIDCEADSDPDAAENIDWLASCVSRFEAQDKPVGIYTGRWWWTEAQTMNNTTVFRDLPLWAATDDKRPDLVFVPFGGWTRLAVEQYDLSGPDRDVIDDSFLEGLNGRKVVAQPTVDEQLSYLGGLTHNVIPDCIEELEAAHGRTAPDQARIDRVLDALRKNAG